MKTLGTAHLLPSLRSSLALAAKSWVLRFNASLLQYIITFLRSAASVDCKFRR